MLADKLVPLPPGEFKLMAASVDEARRIEGSLSSARSTLARVLLVQADGQRVSTAVWASAMLDVGNYRASWVGQPCKRDNTLYRRNRSKDETNQDVISEDCLIVDHRVGVFGAKAQDLFKQAADRLAAEGVRVPIPVMIVANVSRIEKREYVVATYAFNPLAFGCGERGFKPWAQSPWHRDAIAQDAQKVQFVQSVTTWGEAMQTHFDDIVARRPATLQNVADTARSTAIHRCP
jgi:hypothetical protein